jgi:hypothetical protein
MHQPIDWGRVAVDAVVFAVTAAVTFGIGSACASIGNFYARAAVSALAHGVFQGGMTAAQGGKFWAGFAAGAMSSIAVSFWQGGSSYNPDGTVIAGSGMKGIGGKFADSVTGTLAFGAVMGGAGSALTGGNFWQGAVTGIIVAGFNHVMHGEDPPGKKGQKSPTLKEANEHYRNGNGESMTVDASTVDLNFLDTSKMVKGNIYSVQTLTTSKDGRVYGGIRVKYLGNNQVEIRPDTYNFEQHGTFFSETFRNTANVIGRWYAGDGTAYKINFSGVNTIHYSPPPVSTYSQTSHAFRM